jgi:hypothetical protein
MLSLTLNSKMVRIRVSPIRWAIRYWAPAIYINVSSPIVLRMRGCVKKSHIGCEKI